MSISFHKHPKQRTSLILVLAILSGAICLLSVWASPVAGQDQGVRQSPPYDPAQVTTPTTPPIAAAGRASYLENCAPCHGEQGMGNGPTVVDLPDPPTAFADRTAIWERSPSMLFHTTKFGRLEKLMPPWSNQLTDDQIWDTVAYAWSLHTKESETSAGAALYAESCAACHGAGGAGDGPEAEGELSDFTDLSYTTFVSQADWQSGWETAHADVGAEWSQAQRESALEYIRTFSYIPPWISPLQPGDGVITGQVIFEGDATRQVDGNVAQLDVYLDFEPIATFTTTLSADNLFLFEELTVDPALIYMVTVVADGITHSSSMISLAPEQSQVDTSVTVFGVTESPDDIRINRAHWIIDVQPGALVLAQIYLVGNSGERTFVGRTVEGVDVPVTVGFDIPVEAQEITFQNGALGDRFRRVGDIVYDTVPVTPGDSTQQIIVQYVLLSDGTSFDFRQELLYPTDSLSLLVTNFADLRVDAPELTFDSVENIQGTEYQLWRTSDAVPGQIEVKLQGLPEPGGIDPRSAASTSAGGTTQLSSISPPMEAWVSWVMIALVAASLLGVAGVAIQRGAFASTPSRRDLQVLQESLITEIARIDDLHALGQLSDTEWLRRRTNLKAQLMDVMRRLDVNSGQRA
jgi:mono/diheme cytochrome c family protein